MTHGRKQKRGHPALIVCGDLVKAIKGESAIAIGYWFGPSPTAVWKLSKALDVPWFNEVTKRLDRKHVFPVFHAATRGRPQSIEHRRKLRLLIVRISDRRIQEVSAWTILRGLERSQLGRWDWRSWRRRRGCRRKLASPHRSDPTGKHSEFLRCIHHRVFHRSPRIKSRISLPGEIQEQR